MVPLMRTSHLHQANPSLSMLARSRKRLVEALQYDHGYLHGELFVRPDGSCVMSEIAARLSGCEVPLNHGLAYGFDILQSIMDTYVDRAPTLNYTEDRAAGDLLLPITKGSVKHVTPVEKLKRLAGVVYATVSVTQGQYVDPPRASGSCSGYVPSLSGVIPRRLKKEWKTLLIYTCGDYAAHICHEHNRWKRIMAYCRKARPASNIAESLKKGHTMVWAARSPSAMLTEEQLRSDLC